MHSLRSLEPNERTVEPGRWGRVPAAAGAEVDPITWEESPSLRTRLTRAMSVPAVVGVAVFIVVLVATALIVLRGISADTAQSSTEAQALARMDSTEEQPIDLANSGALGDDAGTSSAGTTGESGASASSVMVHVVGEVQRPGVVELTAGSRVIDAIAAAGGANDQAGLGGVNLARVVADGEQILVPDAEAAAELTASGVTQIPEAPLTGGSTTGMINLNHATAEDLERLPKIGPALAARIVEWRESHGGFKNIEQLLEVSGIGAKTLEQFRDQVVV
ncbi:MAG: helix-hairpin-helix domain-containing protein [Leucobacter sp.]